MENALIVLLLTSGVLGGIYTTVTLSKLCDAVAFEEMGENRYD